MSLYLREIQITVTMFTQKYAKPQNNNHTHTNTHAQSFKYIFKNLVQEKQKKEVYFIASAYIVPCTVWIPFEMGQRANESLVI